MRKQGLPLQRLTTVESLTGVADGAALAGHRRRSTPPSARDTSLRSTSCRRLVASVGGEEGATEDIAEAATPVTARRHHRRHGDPGVVVKGIVRRLGQAGPLLHPGARRHILGFVTRGNGVSVHRRDCTNADSLSSQPERIIEVEWAPTLGSVFLVQLQVEALDRSRLLSDVTRVISDSTSTSCRRRSRPRATGSRKLRFTFEMGDPAHLGHVVRAVQKVDGVFDAYRVTGGRRTDA